MAYIQPDSEIQFFSDLGLSQDYNDSLYFASLADKDAYFSNSDFRLATVTKCTYTRERRGFVRVELPMSTLIHAQYMRFKNTSFENKWWYAFVTDVVYINNITTEVQFEIDPLMSWMGAFSLAECFVERQHSATDAIGDNLVDEPVNTGEYMTVSDDNTGLFDEWCYMIFFTPTVVGGVIQPDSKAYDQLGVYSGLSVRIYDDDSLNHPPDERRSLLAMQTFLGLDGIFNNVQMIAYVPKAFIPRILNYVLPYEGAYDYDDPDRQTAPVSFTKSVPINQSLAGGYQPRNNKLFTYPYNFLSVWNSENQENEYRYEMFSNLSPSFIILSQLSEKTDIACVPLAYRGISLNYSESVHMKDFPHCSWASDAWVAFLAQQLSSGAVRLLSAVTMDNLQMQANDINVNQTMTHDKTRVLDSTAYFGATGNSTSLRDEQRDVLTRPLGHYRPPMAEPLAIRGILLDGFSHLTSPSSVHGEFSSDILAYERDKDFWFYKRSVRPEYAKMIDDYFTMFGYADKTVHVPQMNVRQRFTYVKTVGCKVNCLCPSGDINFIENIFNKGIRFWKNHEEIGDYSTANLPLT